MLSGKVVLDEKRNREKRDGFEERGIARDNKRELKLKKIQGRFIEHSTRPPLSDALGVTIASSSKT
eukprot:1325532-Amorphochlora_amoeboformis.AAC.1